jgi:hypothetical protein
MNEKQEFIVLRENEKVAGNVSLERQVYAQKDGLLEQNLSINEKSIPVDAREWMFSVKGSYDTLLTGLDKHWKRLKNEFNTLAEEAAFYHHAKTNSPIEGDALRREFVLQTAITLSDHMLNQTIPDEELEQGKISEEHYPVITISHRMDAMRTTAQKMKIPLDGFENNIRGLSKRAYEAVAMYDKIVLGDDDEDKREMQHTAADSEYDDEESWRGNGEDEDTPPYEEQECEECGVDDVEAWKESLEDGEEEKEPWQDEDHDPDDERDDKIDDLLEDYVDYVVDFTHAANNLWMEAVVQIKNGQRVTFNSNQIDGLKDIMRDTRKAYEAFKEAAEATAAGQYELKAVFEHQEDEKQGTLPRMQKLISMASRPKQLEETIKKARTKGLEH